MGLRLSLFPRDEQFFDLYKQMAGEIRAAAGLLERLLAVEPPEIAVVDLIKDAEHRCDGAEGDAG